MRIDFVEIAHFRKLHSTRVSFSKTKTVFVGANNSGKTSAMVALRYFLIDAERSRFSLNDFTLSHWPKIDAIGQAWEAAAEAEQPLPTGDWEAITPLLDVWLHVEPKEVHYVQRVLPTLDWEAGQLGVRLRLEPKDLEALQKDYLACRNEARNMKLAGAAKAEEAAKAGGVQQDFDVTLWPQCLTEYLQRRFRASFVVQAYVLDPTKCADPEHGIAIPQALGDAEPVADPFKGLIKVNEISAQRGFGQPGEGKDIEELKAATGTRQLSDQLRRYYTRHLDPYQCPDGEDLLALKAIEDAQKAFDVRLQDGFSAALKEMEKLGYPGVTDPKLHISTRLRPVDGLDHEAAVQYVIPLSSGEAAVSLHLPEDSNGLGYQNLVSMVFRLMSFRDAWMRVGKAGAQTDSTEATFIQPLHLVLVEEPEAHLHTQVQQVFIRQAYEILRNHRDLGKQPLLSTQLVVSTHSSHVAHECEFETLRYFRRLPATEDRVPTSCVINLTKVFGEEDDTKRFVTRYLKVTHCDLFFADAAILIEGQAERILAPHFVRTHDEFKDLTECYITWLEIGGSHAHKLESLITHLGLTTLIIADLDPKDADNKSVRPARGVGQTTRNQTLKTWCPAEEQVDTLLDLAEDKKFKSYEKERFAVRVAYQCPVNVTIKGSAAEALAYTLEDAIVFENLELFAKPLGGGLLAKFQAAIAASANVVELSEAIRAALKDGSKAELAMDLLEIKDAKALKPPTYIRNGLLWLAAQLRVKQKELGLALPSDAAKPAANDDKAEAAGTESAA